MHYMHIVNMCVEIIKLFLYNRTVRRNQVAPIPDVQPEHIAIDMERVPEASHASVDTDIVSTPSVSSRVDTIDMERVPEASHASVDTDIVSTPSVSSPVDTMVLESVTSVSSTHENTFNNVGIYA